MSTPSKPKIEKQQPARKHTESVFADLAEVAERFEREVQAGRADAPRMRPRQMKDPSARRPEVLE